MGFRGGGGGGGGLAYKIIHLITFTEKKKGTIHFLSQLVEHKKGGTQYSIFIVDIKSGRFLFQSGRAGDEAKKHVSCQKQESWHHCFFELKKNCVSLLAGVGTGYLGFFMTFAG